MKTLFFVGNKRSGTTLLMTLLNFSKKIIISNESDLVWILYQFENNATDIKRYPEDSPKGFNKTMKSFINFVERDSSVQENFIRITRSLVGHHKEDIKVLGDQKMFQHTDPKVLNFINRNFSEPHFIHVYRHPMEVIRSQMNFQAETGALDYDNIWRNKSKNELLSDWAKYEERVDNIKKDSTNKVLDIDYNSLINHPIREINKVSRFLEVSFSIREKLKIYSYCRKKKHKPLDINHIENKKVLNFVKRYSLSKTPQRNLWYKFENFCKKIIYKLIQ